VTSTIDLARLNIRDDAWEFVEITEDFIRHRAPIERHANGDVVYVYRTTPRAIDAMLEDNKRSFEESHGKRFGDGQIVGRIPLNVLFDPKNQLAQKIREGDRDHIKWWLDSEEARPYRTFRGRLT
jgi:hypothetical protein